MSIAQTAIMSSLVCRQRPQHVTVIDCPAQSGTARYLDFYRSLRAARNTEEAVRGKTDDIAHQRGLATTLATCAQPARSPLERAVVENLYKESFATTL